MPVRPLPDPGCASCAARDERIAEQRELIGELQGAVGEQADQIAALKDQIARLERLVSRNSGNSSMPPSADDRPGKKPPAPKQLRPQGRRPGKQKGAPGAHLVWNDHPDNTVPVYPPGACPCGNDLSAAADLGGRHSHQVTDLPQVKAETTQYDRHEVRCACGRTHVADAPAEAGGAAPGTVTYGLGFQAWCVFLMVMHHVPVERCADIIESMSGTRPSDGWVHALLARAARAVAAANKTIRVLILLARVICGDETPVRSGPGPKTAKKYLHVACTDLLTTTSSASGPSARSRPSSTATCTAPSSCTTAIRTTTTSTASRTSCAPSTCCATSKTPPRPTPARPGPSWPPASCALIHQANLARARSLPAVTDSAVSEHLKMFRNAVNAGLSAIRRVPGANEKQPPGRLLLECLKYREADVLRFLTDTAIPPTSNQAERDLRPAKTQQKISGRLRSVTATRHRYAIRGFASTAAKHGLDIFTAIRDALTGNCWITPIPAST